MSRSSTWRWFEKNSAMFGFFLLFLLSFFLIAGVSAQPSSSQGLLPANGADIAPADYVKARLLADRTKITSGQPFKLGIELKMSPGWHTYYLHSGEAGMPTKVEWILPKGFKSSALLWKKPSKFNDEGIITYGYAGTAIIVSEVTPPGGLKPGQQLEFGAKVKWLSCKDVCVPGGQNVMLTLPVAGEAEQVVLENTEQFAEADFNGPTSEIKDEPAREHGDVKNGEPSATSIIDTNLQLADANAKQPSLFVYLGFAFIGGFILNLMPCVLPVISIKIFSLIQQAGEDHRKTIQHGITFSFGIILSFLALALMVITIQSTGQKIGWGFQFQYPIFVLAMCAVVTLFALSMFGVFYIQVTAGQSQIDKLASSEGLAGTFFKGVLATVLSTPCTAPFLGTALGFAFAQPWWLILAVFFTIALGMASPYILLTLQPSWMKYLPKPGTWMEKFKESMGFLLVATVVWLLWILAHQVGIDAALGALAFLVCLAFASWLIGGLIDLTSTGQRKCVVWILALVVVGLGYYAFLRPFPSLLSIDPAMNKPGVVEMTESGNGIAWKPFTLSELDKQVGQGKTVFIDFTADWCLTCKANEQTVINTGPVIQKIQALKVVPLRADWTTQDPEITKLLQKFGRSGVPLYVLFPAGKPTEPIILPEVITQSSVLEALDKAGPSR